MAEFFWFSDEQWARIEPLLPRNIRRPQAGGRSPGAEWHRPCPAERRAMERLPQACLRAEEDALQPLRALGRAGCVGGRLSRPGRRRRGARQAVHRQQLHQGPSHRRRRKRGALAHGIGQTRGGRNTKLHAVCDGQGRPWVLLLTPGNTHDMRVAKDCIAALPPSTELVADKGYDSDDLRRWLAERGTRPIIPPKRHRRTKLDCDTAIYRQRKHHRAHVLPLQGLAPHRHPLRPQDHQLPGDHHYRRYRHLVALMSPDPSTHHHEWMIRMTTLHPFRPGAWSAVMQRITRVARRRPKGMQGRPQGRVPRPPDGVTAACRCAASPVRHFLPGGRGTRSYVSSIHDGGY